MSNKSGTASHIISLPQGGGAVQGIGEKFSPDLHTGTGNFTVPIALPRSRNSLQPQLSLGYSTGSGNGPFGLGWGVSIPGVSRQTSKGVPRYDDATDIFVLSGAEDLVPVPGGAAGVTRYRPRTEGLFARIEHHHAPGNDYWEVRSKDGLVSVYGTPGAAGNDLAVVADLDRTNGPGSSPGNSARRATLLAIASSTNTNTTLLQKGRAMPEQRMMWSSLPRGVVISPCATPRQDERSGLSILCSDVHKFCSNH